jgi:hypothetical protein
MPTLVTLLTAMRAQAGCSFPDWEADAANGCARYASGTCLALARCDDLLAPYGSYEACESQLSQGCTYSLGLPDVIGTGAGAAACGDMMMHVECDAIRNGKLPAGCQAPSGTRSEGAPCHTGAQCASARCTEYDGTWGVCRERERLGGACSAQSDCRAGLLCSLAGECTALGLRGEPCSVERPCRAPLACVAGSCIPIDAAPTCQGYADMSCAQLARCSPALLRAVYDDVDACSARTFESCLSSLRSAGHEAAVRAGIAGCTAELASVSCEQLLDHALPAACQLLPGERADGEPCDSAAQCASMRCAFGSDSACGVCSPLAEPGGTCAADSDCVFGAVCGGGSCRVPGQLAAPCDPAQRCAYPWVCAGGACSDAHGPGEPCSFGADRCDRYQGLFCGASGKCGPWQSGLAGAACNQTATEWTVCGGGSSCVASVEGAACAGPLPDQAPCRPDQAPYCLAPAQCVGGACTLPSSVSCP